MGIAAALGAAAAWAVSATMMASQTRRVDSLSISAVRLIWASAFFVVILIPMGARGDLARMPVSDIAQLIATGAMNLVVGDTIYIVAIAALGMSLAYTVSLGLFAFFSFLLSVILLDEPVGALTAVGSVLVIAGVAIVALYGRQQIPASESAATTSGASGTAGEAAPRPESEAMPRGPVAVLRLIGVVPRRMGMAQGLLIIVIAAIVWAFGTVWLRSLAEDYSATAVGVVRIPPSAGLLMLMAFATPGSALRQRRLERRSFSTLALAGVIGGGLGTLFFVFAIQELGAGKTAVLSSVSPVIALPLAAIFLGERITIWLVAGTLLAVLGIILIS